MQQGIKIEMEETQLFLVFPSSISIKIWSQMWNWRPLAVEKQIPTLIFV